MFVLLSSAIELCTWHTSEVDIENSLSHFFLSFLRDTRNQQTIINERDKVFYFSRGQLSSASFFRRRRLVCLLIRLPRCFLCIIIAIGFTTNRHNLSAILLFTLQHFMSHTISHNIESNTWVLLASDVELLALELTQYWKCFYFFFSESGQTSVVQVAIKNKRTEWVETLPVTAVTLIEIWNV